MPETITIDVGYGPVTLPYVNRKTGAKPKTSIFVSCRCGKDYILDVDGYGPFPTYEFACPFCGGTEFDGVAGCSGDIFNAIMGEPRLYRLCDAIFAKMGYRHE